MEHKNQIVFLGNTPFEIFGQEQVLKEHQNLSNRISLSELPVKAHAYDFLYNKTTRMIETTPRPEKIADYERVIFPIQIAGLKEQMNGNDIHYLNKESKSNGWGIYFADDYLRGYLKGRPVEYEFDGTTFRLDVLKEQLIEVARPENIIKLSEVPSSPWGYEINYNPDTRNVVSDAQINERTKLYNLDQMVNDDPLGMAKRYNISIGRLPNTDNDLKFENVIKSCQEFTGKLSAEEKKVVKGIIPRDTSVTRPKRPRIRR